MQPLPYVYSCILTDSGTVVAQSPEMGPEDTYWSLQGPGSCSNGAGTVGAASMGIRCQGRTPMQTFLDSKQMAQEKKIA